MSHVKDTPSHIAFTNAVVGTNALKKGWGLVRLAVSRFLGRNEGVGASGAAGVGDVVSSLKTGSAQTKTVAEHPRMNDLTFDSRATYRFGCRAVRYQLAVIKPTFPMPTQEQQKDPNYRHRALLDALQKGPVVIEMREQRLEAGSPEEAVRLVEDMDADWTHIEAKPRGVITLPRQDLVKLAHDHDPAWEKRVQDVHDRPVDPVKDAGPFGPLGQAPRARGPVYRRSWLNRLSSPRLGLPEAILQDAGAQPLASPPR
jgi:hypothetical protein